MLFTVQASRRVLRHRLTAAASYHALSVAVIRGYPQSFRDYHYERYLSADK